MTAPEHVNYYNISVLSVYEGNVGLVQGCGWRCWSITCGTVWCLFLFDENISSSQDTQL